MRLRPLVAGALLATASVCLAATASFKVSSGAFAPGQPIPARYTCDGEDAIPPLRVAGTPASAKSLALIVDDPDAPGGAFTHWLAWSIPPTTTSIVGTESTHGKNDFGRAGWSGPCPPFGKPHHYVFHLYALDAAPSLSAGEGRATVERALKGHVLAETTLIGTYQRRAR